MPNDPFIHPDVAAAQAAAHQAGLAARRAHAAPPKGGVPVAGGRAPAIPRLDSPAPAQGGFTMEQHAMAERGELQGIKTGPKILPTDTLPESVRTDPAFISGQGAMMAINQPALAAKHGVVRSGQFIPPQKLQPRAGGTQFRPETLEGLKKIAEIQNQQVAPSIVEQPPSERAEALGKIGNLPGDDSNKPLSEADKKVIQESIQNMDEFQWDTFRQAMMKDLLNNEEQKAIIEARLEPMNIEDLIMNMSVQQKVRIIPGKFEPTFSSVSGETDLAIKRLIMEDSKSLQVDDRYFLDKFALMSVCACLHSVNGKPLPLYVDGDGNFNDELFRKKFNTLLRYPMHMLASLGVNAFWFEVRVRSLFIAEKVGNG